MSFSNYEKEIIELKFTELNNYLDARKMSYVIHSNLGLAVNVILLLSTFMY